MIRKALVHVVPEEISYRTKYEIFPELTFGHRGNVSIIILTADLLLRLR